MAKTCWFFPVLVPGVNEAGRAEVLAGELVKRRQAETEEEEKVREIMKKVSMPQGKVVIDGEGMKVQEWVT